LDATADGCQGVGSPSVRGRRRLAFDGLRRPAPSPGGARSGICQRTPCPPDCPACRTRAARRRPGLLRGRDQPLPRAPRQGAAAPLGRARGLRGHGRPLRHGRADAAQALRRYARRQPRLCRERVPLVPRLDAPVRRRLGAGTIIKCLRTFYDEGPSGGHYQNMMMDKYRTLGCAVHVTGGGVTIVQDYGR
jgi:hypothetical protein